MVDLGTLVHDELRPLDRHHVPTLVVLLRLHLTKTKKNRYIATLLFLVCVTYSYFLLSFIFSRPAPADEANTTTKNAS